ASSSLVPTKLSRSLPQLDLLLISSAIVYPPLFTIAMPRKQRQVMWPRLIASKLFEKRSGSNNFLADFPTNGGILVEIPPLEQEYLSPKIFSNKFLETLDYK
ncbi:phosphoinositide 5-phosphatase, partial [Sarracenia purpurea var. burkii]